MGQVVSLSLENLKEKGYKFNITTSLYSVEYKGDIIARGYPNLLFKNRKGSRYNLNRNLELAHSDADRHFFMLEDAINHIGKNGNLVLFGNNLFVIMNLYEILIRDNTIIYNEQEKSWGVIKPPAKFIEEMNLNEQ